VYKSSKNGLMQLKNRKKRRRRNGVYKSSKNGLKTKINILKINIGLLLKSISANKSKE
jgi:hypothetical protein